MNRTAILYSRSFLGLDIKVWGTLLVVVLVSIVLLAFKMLGNTNCEAVSFYTQGTVVHKGANVFYINESISFKASTGRPNTVQWNFDDGSPVTSGTEKKHSFSAEGDYLVTAIVDGRCREIIPITIVQRSSNSRSLNEESLAQSPIIGKTFATAGMPERYTCNLSASKYKWTLENNIIFEEKFGQSVSFSFSDTGTYNLTLELDEDLTKTWKQMVVVRSASANESISDPSLIPPPNPGTFVRRDPVIKEDESKTTLPDNTAPPLPDPAPLPTKPTKKFIQVPKPELESMLQDVVEKKRNVPDFENILCDGGNTKVTANNKTMTFSELCQRLQERKGLFKSKVKNLLISSAPYDSERKCLITMYVEFKQ